MGYLAPSAMTELEDEVNRLMDVVKIADVGQSDDSDEEREFSCKICFDLPEGEIHACTTCEMLLCDDCKIRHCHRGTRYVQCPGCRADFTLGVNPRRSRMAETVVKKILKKQKENASLK